MRRAQRRKFHYFYKTTCTITNRYYYGMHSTDNLNDGYIGSGKRLWYSINKHGKENHICEKIEFFETREKLKEREIEIVNEDLLKDRLCMNLQPGGGGGFYNIEHMHKCSNAGLKKLWNDPLFIERHKKRWVLILIKINKSVDRSGFNNGFYNKKHTLDSKQKIGKTSSLKQTGQLNSQYDTCWITNEKENKKIHKNEVIPDGWRLGRKQK